MSPSRFEIFLAVLMVCVFPAAGGAHLAGLDTLGRLSALLTLAGGLGVVVGVWLLIRGPQVQFALGSRVSTVFGPGEVDAIARHGKQLVYEVQLDDGQLIAFVDTELLSLPEPQAPARSFRPRWLGR